MMNRRSFLKTTSVAVGAIAIGSTLAEGVQAQTAESRPAFAVRWLVCPYPAAGKVSARTTWSSRHGTDPRGNRVAA